MQKLVLVETDKIKLREYLKSVLSVGEHTVVFEKKNGDIRVLKGTRDPNIIGKELFEKYMSPPPKLDGSPRAESVDSLPTYDLDADGWRSFSFDNLIGVDGINTNTLLTNAQIIIEG